MFSLNDQLELRKVTVSSLITCIYLPSIITFISYKGILYSVGNGSSCFILGLIFVAELLKSFYLNSSNDIHGKKNKANKNDAGDILKGFVYLLCAKFAYFIGIILFGAPVLECHEETLMLSSLLTLLTVFPLLLHVGIESSVQLLFGARNYGKDTIVEMLVSSAMMTVCGAWVGAVVIPLDWNTPWQKWPIPCYLGAVLGFLLSNVLTVLRVTLSHAAQKYPSLDIIVQVINGCQLTK